jgi:hypothetical protein
MRPFLRARSPDYKVRMCLFRMKGRRRHTKVSVRGIITNKICALSGLLCQKFNDPTVGLDFLDRFGLVHKGINVVHNLDEANDAIVTIHLRQDDL